MRLRRPHRSQRRHGAALVETALVLPIFFVLVFGLIEMASLGLSSQLLTIAANSGCRVGVINNHSQADVVATVKSVMNSGGISSNSYTLVTIPADVTTTHLGDAVTVTISVPFSGVSWFSPSLFLASATIRSSATLSSERP